MHVLEQPPSQPRYASVVQQHEAGLQRLANRILGDRGQAEEVAQDSMLKLSGNPVLDRPDEEILAWLRRITLNGAFNRLRAERRARDRLTRAARLDAPPDADGANPLGELLAAEERDRVRLILRGLPERQRAILLLRSSGCSYAEVAAAVGVAPGSVGTLIARAERAFRRSYEATTSGELT